MAMASSGEVQGALQAAAQSLRWTYSLLWQLCPHQGALVWTEGHYNGAIKTRKTVQPVAEAAGGGEGDQAAARHRSRQLRELYESLAREADVQAGAGGGWGSGGGGGGGGAQQVQQPAAARRPSAALSPEDLTETEWFYLMSASYSFAPSVGLPGKAYAGKGHVWLTGANDVDSRVFSRAILAKSAGIQTVVCIPIANGVLEIGTTKKVEEDIGLIHYATNIFMDQHDIHMMPTISEHSTSNPVRRNAQESSQAQRKIYAGHQNVDSNMFENNQMEDYKEIDEVCASGSETNAEKNYCQHAPLNNVSNEQKTPNAASSELMNLGTSERARDGCSNNYHDEIQMFMVCENSNEQSNMQEEPCQSWNFLYEDLCGDHAECSGAGDQAISPENSHYSETVLTILHHNGRRQSASRMKSYLAVSHQSSFTRWNPTGTNLVQSMITECTSQRMLKSILFNVPSSHHKYRRAQSPELRVGEGAVGLKTEAFEAIQGDYSATHVVKERQRREKLNERFIALRSLVPFVTKMDKASILGDTIEYVKQLRKRIQDLESRTRQLTDGDSLKHHPATSKQKAGHFLLRSAGAALPDRRKKTGAGEGSSSGSSSSTGKPDATDVQVSIIESDALLEIRCPGRDGLLLRIMQLMQELQLEVTSAQASSSAGGVLVAELRAKVTEVHGRRSSITEVKRAIHLIISSG